MILISNLSNLWVQDHYVFIGPNILASDYGMGFVVVVFSL
jgi:hypothetical protein